MECHERKRVPSSPEEWITHARIDLNLAALDNEVNASFMCKSVCMHGRPSDRVARIPGVLAKHLTGEEEDRVEGWFWVDVALYFSQLS